jgi:integrase/recombinase XerC
LDAKRISAKTRYTWLSSLGCFYRWAIKAGYTTTDPTADIDRPKLRRTLPRPVTDADLLFALSMTTGQAQAWIILAAYAGLRCAEIAGLHRDDVIGDAGLLRVVGKGHKERLVPMHPQVIDLLAGWRMPRANGPIFTRPSGGAWPPARLSRLASIELHDIGIDATLHQFRHWFGTRTYQHVKDIRVVQELLGHSSPTTTAIYTAFSAEDARKAVASL